MENQDTLKRRSLPFTQIENAIIEDERITRSEILVYLILCYHANNDTDQCYPGIRKIAGETRLSKNTVNTAIEGLIDKRYITKTQRKNPDNPKQNFSNLYTINTQYKYVKANQEGGGSIEYPRVGIKEGQEQESLNNIKKTSISKRSKSALLPALKIGEEPPKEVKQSKAYKIPGYEKIIFLRWEFDVLKKAERGSINNIHEICRYIHLEAERGKYQTNVKAVMFMALIEDWDLHRDSEAWSAYCREKYLEEV